MTPAIARALATVAAVAVALASMPAEAETYQPVQPKEPFPPGWVCKWSMDIKGKQILGKSKMVDGGPSNSNAAACDIKACIALCTDTSGCIAIKITKTKAYGEKCHCQLYESVFSSSIGEGARTSSDGSTRWTCSPVRKPFQPPITDIPKSFDRPPIEQDQMRPPTPDSSGRR